MKLFFLFFVFMSGFAAATETQPADVYESLKIGKIPMPYGSFRVYVKLNERNNSVSQFEIKVGEHEIRLSEEQISRFKNIDLSNLYVGHEIFRADEAPYKKFGEDSKEYFVIKISTYDGIEKNHAFYADYYDILVDLETRKLKLSKVVNERPN